MISITDIKTIPLFQGLTEEVFTKLYSMASAQTVQKDDVVFEEDDAPENIYIVKHGNIVLEKDLSPEIVVSLAQLKPGYLFGLYGMMPFAENIMRARAAEDTDLIVLPGDDLRMFMDEDHHFGYQFMNKMYALMQIRLHRRTRQFLSVLAKHPELQA